MLEMASLGSKVLQTRSVEFAGKYKVKLRVLSSFSPNNEGTEINFEEKIEQFLIDVLNNKSDYLNKKENLKKLNYQNTWINVNQKILKIINEN